MNIYTSRQLHYLNTLHHIATTLSEATEVPMDEKTARNTLLIARELQNALDFYFLNMIEEKVS